MIFCAGIKLGKQYNKKKRRANSQKNIMLPKAAARSNNFLLAKPLCIIVLLIFIYFFYKKKVEELNFLPYFLEDCSISFRRIIALLFQINCRKYVQKSTVKNISQINVPLFTRNETYFDNSLICS